MVSADYKPWQLQVASECGLQVPATLITNSPLAAREFFERCQGQMVYKTLSGGLVMAESGEALSIYTSQVTHEDLQSEGERVRLTACLFQELVPKQVELRITIVGTQVFAAELSYRTPEDAALDWRTAYQHLQYRVYDLPEALSRACLAFVRRLGLAFAALDLVVTPDGRYVLLEANSTGQWAWIERATGLPICAALVDMLTGESPGK